MVSSSVHADAVTAFACFGQPTNYIEQDLCEPERDEYEQMLGGKPRELIDASDFGTVAWSPFCFLTPEAMAYLLPRLMQLAASSAKDAAGELFMMRFINRFSGGPTEKAFSLLSAQYRVFIADFLNYLAREHGPLVEAECWNGALAEPVRNWRDA